MAGGRKEYELLFKLKASLGGNFNGSFQKAMKTTKQLQGTLSKINSLSGKIDGYKKQSEAVSKNKDKLNGLKQEHEKLQQELSKTEKPSEALRKKFEKSARQIETTTNKIRDQEKRLGDLGEELREAGVNTNNLEAANDKLARSYGKIKRSQEEVARISAAQQKNAEQVSQVKGQLLGTVGVITAVGAAIYAGPVSGAKDFKKAMAKVGTIADETAVPLSAMGKDVIKLSNEMGVAANAIAEDVYNAISAGQDTADAVGFVEQATKLAKGGFAETGQALDVLTTILNAYDMESREAVAVSNMLIQTQNKGKVTVAELSSVMGKIIPTAKANNVALEQLGAGYAIMTSKGIAAAESTTYMNSMLNELGKTGSKSDKVLRKTTGSNFKELMKSGKSLAEVLEIVEKSASDNGLSLSDMFGRAEAGKAALTLMAGGVDGFNNSVNGMLNSAGATEKAFKQMMGTDDAKVEKAKNSIKNISIVIGQTFLPHVGKAADKVTELVTKLAEFSQENPEVIETVTKVVAGLMAFKVATLGTKLAFLELRGGALAAQKVFSVFRGNTAAAGVEAMGLSSRLARSGAGIKGYFTGVGSATGNVFSKAFGGGKIAKAFSGVGKMAKGAGGKMLGAFGGAGGKVVSTLGGVGTKIAGGPLGKLGGVIAKPFMKLGGLISPLMNLGSAILGPFSGIFGKIFPVVGVVMLIIAAIQILRDNMDKVRAVVEKVFGKAGLEVFDKVIATIGNIGNAIKNVFSDEGISGIKAFIDETFGDNPALANFLNGFVDVFGTIGNIIGEFITFVDQYVKPVITDVFMFIAETVLPMVAQKFAEWAPTIATIIQGLWEIIRGVVTAIMNVVSFAMPLIKSIVTGALHSIMQVIDGVLTVLKGVINFITGVFTGDWGKAWSGVKDIFKGIFQSLAGLIKAPINAVVSIVNGVVESINKVGFKIPDWVPGVGGKDFSINIPKIPMFAKGTNNTPDTFIAGEKGAELITNAKGRKVFTAAQTGKIFNNINRSKVQNVYSKAKEAAVSAPMMQSLMASVRSVTARGFGIPQLQPAYGMAGATSVVAPTVKADSTRGTTQITIHNQPTIHVDGNAPDDLDDKLKKNNEELLDEVEERMRKKEDDERRGRYE